MTPPPGRLHLSVLYEGRKFSICNASSLVVGFSQLAVKISMSCAVASPRARSILRSILWMLRCRILRKLAKELKDAGDILSLESVLLSTESGPGVTGQN